MSETGAQSVLQLRGIVKKFGLFTAVDHVDLDIREAEFFTIVGPSGSGKTTMIRMLVGMDRPSDGDILLRGKSLNDVPANKRPTCMVFQSLALFPHRTVGENIEFPMKIAGVDRPTRRRRCRRALGAAPLTHRLLPKGRAAMLWRGASAYSAGARTRL